MSTKDQKALEAQLARRKRVNRMKSAIVLIISIWMLVSFLSIIILSVCLLKVNHKVRVLEHIINRSSDVTETMEDVSNTYDSESDGLVASNTEMTQDYSEVIRGIDSEDNFAVEGDSHYVYLTFNCVPSDNTRQLLDVLDSYQLKATFFVSGEVSEENQDILKRIVEDGHTLGMHSFSNQYSKLYASTEAFEEDYKQISDYLYDLTGVRSMIYRFPGGSGNEISNLDMVEFVRILNDNHITYFDWNISSGDAVNEQPSVEAIINNVLPKIDIQTECMILMHDATEKGTTVEALPEIISQIRLRGDAEFFAITDETVPIQHLKAESDN